MNIGGIFEGQTAKNCEKSSNGFLRFLQKGLVTDVPKLAQFITSILSKNVFIKFPYLRKIKMKIVTTTATLTVPWSGLRRRQKKNPLFVSFGVCCVFTLTGSGTITENCTYVQNPNFPGALADTNGVDYTVERCRGGKGFFQFFCYSHLFWGVKLQSL